LIGCAADDESNVCSISMTKRISGMVIQCAFRTRKKKCLKKLLVEAINLNFYITCRNDAGQR
jgi:hypothetical protein